MNQKYVVSLELAIELKECGFPQETDFYWVRHDYEPNYTLLYVGEHATLKIRLHEVFAAPHLGELTNRLPETLPIKARATDYECGYDLAIAKTREGEWEISYCGSGDAGCILVTKNKKLADAIADMFIHLNFKRLL